MTHVPDVLVIVHRGPDAAASALTSASVRQQTLRSLELVETTDVNAALAMAASPWVLVAEAGTEVERHACRNLLLAGERQGADVVSGRVDGADGALRLAPGTLVRRALLLEHALLHRDGLEGAADLLALQASAVATVVACIPEVTGRVPAGEQRSPADSVAILREMEAFLGSRGLVDARRELDRRFLREDAAPLLAGTLTGDEGASRTLLDAMGPAVAGMESMLFRELPPALRVAVYHLLVGDVEGVRAAMAFEAWGATVGATIVADGDRERWSSGQHLAGPDAAGIPARDWLDVTDLHLLSIPFTQRIPLHRTAAMARVDGALRMTGTTIDICGDLGDEDLIEIRVTGADGAPVAVAPAVWTEAVGNVRTWSVDGPLASRLWRELRQTDGGHVAVAITRGALVNVATLRSPSGDTVSVPFPGRRTATGPDTLVLAGGSDAALAWRARQASTWRRRVSTLRAAWLRVPGMRRLADLRDITWRHSLPERIGGRLRPRPLAVFESDSGRTATGNARAISEYLHRRHPEIRQAWVFRTRADLMPDYAEPVERHSTRHHWRANSAAFWVDDGLTSLWIGKPPRTVAMLAGWGVPVHRMGLDDPSLLVRGPAVRNLARRYRRYDLFVAASRFGADLVGPALALEAEPVEAGLPRMDAVLGVLAEGPDAVAHVRDRLDLPRGRRIVMYAPTVRVPDQPAHDPLLDLDSFAQSLGSRTYLLVRPHPAEALIVPERLRFAVRDVRDADLADLVAASDLVVSDYSSVIGDAAAADLPVVLFQPDQVEFEHRTHGIHAGSGAAGPIVTSSAELIGEVSDWLDDPEDWERRHAPGRRQFAAERCGAADGRAAERAVDALLASGGFA